MFVLGYTTAMSSEEYPETWVSSWLVFGNLVVDLGMAFVTKYYEEIEMVLEFNNIGGSVIYNGDELGLIGEGAGVAALYTFSAWLMVVSGWTLFIGIFIIIEIAQEIN